MTISNQQRQKFHAESGTFIAALDQSGGSTPKALGVYGINPDAWSSEEEMFDLVHAMRTRIITSPVFHGDRILGAILFENTMDRAIEGRPTADYLWERKGIVPILKVDKGLEDEQDGVQRMKPNPGLATLLDKALSNAIFGTKMRSVIRQANATGIHAIVHQQVAIGKEILATGLVPILEPEIDIHCPNKAEAESLLLPPLLAELDALPTGQQVMLKLTLPEKDNFYADCIAHPHVLKVFALSGGYSREEANTRLARQHRMVASFSRALVEGLSVHQPKPSFDAKLETSIEAIFQASKT